MGMRKVPQSDLNMKLKIGESVRELGKILFLSRKGNLRIWKGTNDPGLPLGINSTILIRGRVAYEISDGTWRMDGTLDPQLTAVSNAYFPKDETV